MKVILKQNIKGIGRKYEIKEVSDGYANNFLLPKKLVEYASPEAIKKAQILEATQQAELEIREKIFQSQIEQLKDVKITLTKKANEKGHLFEKIHPEEIILALKNQTKIDLPVDSLKLSDPIKQTGEHRIPVLSGHHKGEFVLVVEKLV